MELGNDIPSSCSTHQYFGSSKYELLTPSQSGDMNFSFLPTRKTVFYSVTLCNLHRVFMKKTCFCNFFSTSKKIFCKTLFSSTFFLSNILSMKYSDFNFYWNRSSRTWLARAIRSPGNGSKMSPGTSCYNGADHIPV